MHNAKACSHPPAGIGWMYTRSGQRVNRLHFCSAAARKRRTIKNGGKAIVACAPFKRGGTITTHGTNCPHHRIINVPGRSGSVREQERAREH